MFHDPEFLAFRGVEVPAPLYRVRFSSNALGWHHETAADTVDVEVYEGWLSCANEDELAVANGAPQALDLVSSVPSTQPDCNRHSHSHSHGHSHGEEHYHGTRHEVEANAVLEDTNPEYPGEKLVEALISALTANAVVDKSALANVLEKVDVLASGALQQPEAIGPKLVAKAWVDDKFKQALLHDAASALHAAFGFDATNATAPTKLIVVANERDTHNLVVCTLCSCYPLTILGLSPAWYKDVRFRARAVRTPRSLLAEFGTELAKDTQLRVHDSTADCRYLVLPARPDGTEGWTEDELAKLVTRDSMIGVRVPNVL